MTGTVESVIEDLHNKDLKGAAANLQALSDQGHNFGGEQWKLDMAAINERVDLKSLGLADANLLLGADQLGNLLTSSTSSSFIQHWKPDGSLYAAVPGQYYINRFSDEIQRQVKEDSQRQLGPGDHHLTLIVDGMARDFDLHVPRSYDNKSSMDQVTLLPGANPGSRGLMEGETKANELGEKEGFITVYPHYLEKPVEAPWFWPTKTQNMEAANSPNASITAYIPGYDDKHYLKAVDDAVQARLKIDQKYLFGFSDGGNMGNSVASDCSNDYAVLGSSHGTVIKGQFDAAKACKTAYWGVISEEGSWIPSAGGPGTFTSGMTRMRDSVPLEQFTNWAAVDQCQGEPKRSTTADQSVREFTPEQCGGAAVKEINRFWKGSFFSNHGGGGQHAIDGPGAGGFPFNIGAKGEWNSFADFWSFAKHFRRQPDGRLVHD